MIYSWWTLNSWTEFGKYFSFFIVSWSKWWYALVPVSYIGHWRWTWIEIGMNHKRHKSWRYNVQKASSGASAGNWFSSAPGSPDALFSFAVSWVIELNWPLGNCVEINCEIGTLFSPSSAFLQRVISWNSIICTILFILENLLFEISSVFFVNKN